MCNQVINNGWNIGPYKMIIQAFSLIVWLGVASGTDIEEVDYFRFCGGAGTYDKLVPDGTTLSVTIKSWPEDTYTCTVVFKSYRSSSDLYYRFTTFDLSNSANRNKIEIESKDYSTDFYTGKVTYSPYNYPNIGISKLTQRFLKVSFKRDDLFKEPLSVVFEVYPDGFSAPSTMNAGLIGGLIVGIIVLIIAIVVIVGCYRRCQSKGTNRGVVIQHCNQQVSATRTSATSPGDGVRVMDQFSMYPVHPSAQPRGYPQQPPAYGPAQNMAYDDDPPSYDDVVNGDASLKNYT